MNTQMSIEKIKDLLAETSKTLIVTLLATGLLAIFGLIYSRTNKYVAHVRDYILLHWNDVLSILLFVGYILLLYKFSKLKKSNKILPDSIDSDFQKQLSEASSALKDSLSKVDAKISALTSRVSKIEYDVYTLNRARLYQKARKHDELNERGSLLCRLGVVELDVEKESDFNLEESLEEVYNYVKNERSFTTQDLSDAKNSLNQIKNDGHKVVVEEVLSQIKAKLV